MKDLNTLHCNAEYFFSHFRKSVVLINFSFRQNRSINQRQFLLANLQVLRIVSLNNSKYLAFVKSEIIRQSKTYSQIASRSFADRRIRETRRAGDVSPLILSSVPRITKTPHSQRGVLGERFLVLTMGSTIIVPGVSPLEWKPTSDARLRGENVEPRRKVRQ